MLEKPEEKDLESLILHDMGSNDSVALQKIIRAWDKVHTKGSELGKKNCVAKEPSR